MKPWLCKGYPSLQACWSRGPDHPVCQPQLGEHIAHGGIVSSTTLHEVSLGPFWGSDGPTKYCEPSGFGVFESEPIYKAMLTHFRSHFMILHKVEVASSTPGCHSEQPGDINQCGQNSAVRSSLCFSVDPGIIQV